jgi:hypothetical protein
MINLFGRSPLAAMGSILLVSALVGAALSALGFVPLDMPNIGLDLLRWLLRYFLDGAIFVIPVWLVIRVMKVLGSGKGATDIFWRRRTVHLLGAKPGLRARGESMLNVFRKWLWDRSGFVLAIFVLSTFVLWFLQSAQDEVLLAFACVQITMAIVVLVHEGVRWLSAARSVAWYHQDPPILFRNWFWHRSGSTLAAFVLISLVLGLFLPSTRELVTALAFAQIIMAIIVLVHEGIPLFETAALLVRHERRILAETGFPLFQVMCVATWLAASGGFAVQRTLTPHPYSLMGVQLREHPFASILGALLPTIVLAPVVYFWSRRLLRWSGRLRRRYDAQFKICEHCAEKIKSAAKVCRYCGRDQVIAAAQPSGGQDTGRPAIAPAIAGRGPHRSDALRLNS